MILSPATGRGKLYGSLKDLRILWEDTQRIWDDDVRKDFEENLFTPLENLSTSALRGIDRLSQVMQQMRHDCE